MKLERSSGILLHPSSLPGLYGIGELGSQALRWVDFLADAGSKLWQVLPLGPTGYGDSPYQCFSAFAGNPYLISVERLLEGGLLGEEDLEDKPDFPAERVDFGRLIPWKLSIIDLAYRNFTDQADSAISAEYERFRQAQADWLADFALYMALKEAHGGMPWITWEAELRERQPQALETALKALGESVEKQAFRQFLFFRQWAAVHQRAHERGLRIIGDAPIFVAHDSADVWAHPELFNLDESGRPKAVAGVPPDYFSPTGQLWGNPLYRWQAHKETGYAWWIGRIRTALELVDILRLDHFRGFAAYWQVPGRAKTAEKGRWVRGPGSHLFEALRRALGDLPILAEDLGVITPDVVALRERFELPGMKILQFAFEGTPKDPFLPHNYPQHCAVYTGTHDNDTALGWYERVSEQGRDYCRRYLNSDGSQVGWDMIRACWASVAVMAIAPMQDFLELGNEARMNYPGNPDGNWTWRMSEEGMNEEVRGRISELNYLYDR